MPVSRYSTAFHTTKVSYLVILSNKKHCRKNIFYRKLDPADHKRRKAALPERPPSEEFPISEPLVEAVAIRTDVFSHVRIVFGALMKITQHAINSGISVWL